MRQTLFEAYAALSGFYIRGCDLVTTSVCHLLIFVNNFHKELFSNLSIRTLRLIHPESFKEAEEEILKMQQAEKDKITSIELQLLASAQKVRDHAKNYDDWTEQHSEALESVGQALVETCGWAPESVDQYMQEVVEPIDGIEWG